MNFAARWQIVVDRDVQKALLRIPSHDSERIQAAIAEFELNPYSGDVVKMHGQRDAWRRRIGSYRLFYEVVQESRMVHVYSLQRRTSTTY